MADICKGDRFSEICIARQGYVEQFPWICMYGYQDADFEIIKPVL
jgi:hypothetical protein